MRSNGRIFDIDVIKFPFRVSAQSILKTYKQFTSRLDGIGSGSHFAHIAAIVYSYCLQGASNVDGYRCGISLTILGRRRTTISCINNLIYISTQGYFGPCNHLFAGRREYGSVRSCNGIFSSCYIADIAFTIYSNRLNGCCAGDGYRGRISCSYSL